MKLKIFLKRFEARFSPKRRREDFLFLILMSLMLAGSIVMVFIGRGDLYDPLVAFSYGSFLIPAFIYVLVKWYWRKEDAKAKIVITSFFTNAEDAELPNLIFGAYDLENLLKCFNTLVTKGGQCDPITDAHPNDEQRMVFAAWLTYLTESIQALMLFQKVISAIVDGDYVPQGKIPGGVDPISGGEFSISVDRAIEYYKTKKGMK